MTAKTVKQTADVSAESFSGKVLKTMMHPARLVPYPGAVELPRYRSSDNELPQNFEWHTTALELDEEINHASGRLTALQGDTEGVPLQFLNVLGDQSAKVLVDLKVTVSDDGKCLNVTLRERPGNALGLRTHD